jgi:hypothetical protein
MVVAAREDVAILEQAKRGASQRQIEDAEAVLQVQEQTLDTGYLEKWIRGLQLQAQWDAVRRRAGLAN